ncbi:MAG: endonuclease/exonuclease/phosphatase family protein [Clostridia bacterium]|nr:endonuclease/exonuclease/phosphatase family protein [Clostridia bacterium]
MLKVMTFNIQHALDYQKQVIDFNLFINAIKKYGADICGLNEVRGYGPLEDYTDQTTAIAEGLGFNSYFGEAIKVQGTSPYGNSVVSKFPFKSVETFTIPDPKSKRGKHSFESRCIVKAVVNFEGKDVCLLICHMGLNSSEQKNAVKTICGLLVEMEIPVILMGDFNTTPDSKVLKPLREKLKDTDDLNPIKNQGTYPSDKPNVKIDYIFYRGLKCVKTETIKEIYSDHLPIVAEFEM